jgi:hypothetical protein
MAVNIITIEKVKYVNITNTNIYPEPLININSTNNDRINIYSYDEISFREYYNNRHLYASFEEYIRIKLNINNN